jgi:DNA-binding transcriptional MocR family regulator
MVEFYALQNFATLITQNPTAARTMMMLMHQMQPNTGGTVIVSRETLARMLDTSISSIQRALKVLISEGWIQRIRIGTALAIAINHRVAWTGPRDQIQHAIFSATVIAASNEQDAITLKPPTPQQIPRGEIPQKLTEQQHRQSAVAENG